MFSKPKKKAEPAPAVHSLLGKGMLWKGEIHCGVHSLRIEGTVEGTLHSDGEVVVAPTGLIVGTVHAKHLIVTGRVEGVFRIDECLEIHGTGCVEGDVEVGSLVVDEGGTLQGTCTRRGLPRQVLSGHDAMPTLTAELEVPEEPHGEAEPAVEPTEAPTGRRRRGRIKTR